MEPPVLAKPELFRADELIRPLTCYDALLAGFVSRRPIARAPTTKNVATHAMIAVIRMPAAAETEMPMPDTVATYATIQSGHFGIRNSKTAGKNEPANNPFLPNTSVRVPADVHSLRRSERARPSPSGQQGSFTFSDSIYILPGTVSRQFRTYSLCFRKAASPASEIWTHIWSGAAPST